MKNIEVTDDQIRQKGADCNTFSQEYWLSMTPAQQKELVEIRTCRVSEAAQRVVRNETEVTIRDEMAVLRSSTNKRDEAIRNVYFSIPDERARIQAINDLFCYELVRRRNDEATILEAYYRLAGIRQINGIPRRAFMKIIVVVAVALSVRLAWPGFTEIADCVIAIVIAGGLCLHFDMRRLESHYHLLWEIEKVRCGTHDRDDALQPLRDELFREEERQSGRRSVSRGIPA